MTITQAELDHLAGKGVVVKTWYVDPQNPGVANVSTSLPSGEELELWEDAAFTNGGTLVKIELTWAPKEAAELEALNANELTEPQESGSSGSAR